jgi:hypothetical protein
MLTDDKLKNELGVLVDSESADAQLCETLLKGHGQ